MRPFTNLFFLIIILILALFMTINPRETVQAAAAGFQLWYQVLVPALLPFFIVADLLISLHFVGLLGALLEPVMRPVFRLPGCSALVIAMGFTSGFPMGAVLSRRLMEDNLLSVQEMERLVCFTNNSSPLFIIGAVGVGMFGSPALGYLLAASHYLSNLAVGFLWGRLSLQPVHRPVVPLSQAFKNLWLHLDAGELGLGGLLGSAVRTALNNLLAIAGFMVLFSVLTRMFTVWGVMDHLARFLTLLLGTLGFNHQIALGMSMGLFEITLGARTVAMSSGDTLVKLVAVAAILSFSGFSIIAQVMSIVSGVRVRLSLYLVSRLLQMSLAVCIAWAGYVFWVAPIQSVQSLSIPTYRVLYAFDAWYLSLCSLAAGLIIIALLMLISLLMQTRSPRYP